MQPINESANGDNTENPQGQGFPIGILALVFVCVLILLGIIVYLSREYSEIADRYTFITQSFLNVLILAAIVVQALIYYVQWSVMSRQGKLMEQQTMILERSVKAAENAALAAQQGIEFQNSPRLYIEGVHAERFGVDQTAMFLLKIRNSGQVAAIGIPTDMAIWLMGDKTVSYTKGDQIINIPANGSYEHFIKADFILNAETFKTIMNDGQLLRVEGHVNHVPYCYKYNRMFNEFPNLPMFIPCNFELGRSVGMKGTGGLRFGGSATISSNVRPPPEPN